MKLGNEIVSDSKSLQKTIEHFFHKYRDSLIYFIAFLIFIVFSIALRENFLSVFNIMTILRQTAIVSIMAMGFVFVVSAGLMDLSIGATFGLSSLVVAVFLPMLGIVPSVILALLAGALVGLFNSLLVVKMRVPAFLVTLSTMLVVTGVGRWISVAAIAVTNYTFTNIFGSGDVGKVPVLFIWSVGVMLVFHIVLKKTTFGRYVLACGQNKTAVKFSGINADKIMTMAYIICGTLAALAGVLMAGRLCAARYEYGSDVVYTVVAAAIIGGTSIYGGKGTVIGAVVGSIIIGMINNGLILFGLDITQQMLFRGLVIILAITLGSKERAQD